MQLSLLPVSLKYGQPGREVESNLNFIFVDFKLLAVQTIKITGYSIENLSLGICYEILKIIVEVRTK